MKCIRLVLLLSAAISLHAAANDFTGAWKAVFTGPVGERPKTQSEWVFNLTADSSQVTGVAHMGAWPGDAPISNGKIDGGHITFTVIGKVPYRATNGVVVTTGYPKLVFDGVLKGGEIDLKLNWGGNELDMQARRVPQ